MMKEYHYSAATTIDWLIGGRLLLSRMFCPIVCSYMSSLRIEAPYTRCTVHY
jgi:hypothetical protein